ncbi:MAG: hypothetical protein WCK49_04930 [Myxococcaceae bacterium]
MQVNDISFWSPKKAFVEVTGLDATSFLHRLSTQDILKAPRGQKFGNCFLDQKGRLIDIVIQESVDENGWLLTSSHESPDKLKNWLEKYWFSERLEIKTSTGLGEPEPDRISACLPKAPNEINESYNPLEIGLSKLIAWNKGCYVGQEVISRLDTYDKVSRQLMSVSCKREDFEKLKQSSEITTLLNEYVENHAIALGIFKKASLTSEGLLTTQNGTPVWVVSSAR